MIDLKIIKLIITIGIRFLAHKLLCIPWRFYPLWAKELTIGWRFRLLDDIMLRQRKLDGLIRELTDGR